GLNARPPAEREPMASGEQYDVAIELSGNPAALNDAIACVGFGGRVIVGSWYGAKPATVRLGGRFHRDRVQIMSSQVSTIAPCLRGAWTSARRLALAVAAARDIPADRIITDRWPIHDAARAYAQLDRDGDQSLQVVFTYP
ncbi:MAG: oxidoreductase, partial [Dehalococcoidia bacterium]|nr:oxidoreductase [Dehalococcoidia bacterium]